MSNKGGLFFKSLKMKILSTFLAIGVIGGVLLGSVAVYSSYNAIQKEAINKLGSVAELKTQTLEKFLSDRYGELHVITGLDLFRTACKDLMQEIYDLNIKYSSNIENIWSELERRSKTYTNIKQYLSKYVSSLHAYMELKIVAVYDIYNKDGEVVFKEGDQIFSFNNIKESKINASMYKGAYDLMALKEHGVDEKEYNCPFLYVSSIEFCSEFKKPSIHMSHGIAFPYLSAEQQRMNTPVNKRFSTMLIADINIDSINDIMQESTGMGETGESYLIGNVEGKPGYYMLTQSRMTDKNTIFEQMVDTSDAKRIMSEKEVQRGLNICSNNIYLNYNKTYKVLGHNHYIKMGNHEIGLITEVKESEIFGSANNLRNFIIILVILIVLAVIIISLLIARSISNPLQRVAETLSNSSGQISLASTQLSSSSQEIANGATEQASSIEETTTSMEELASIVKQNASNAREASNLSQKASDSSQTGYTQMEEMLESMTEINKSSGEINKIIKVIDDIAFQTNILALNAAVEAARAGEAGMGFAVVADEVKNLANRAAEAAKETAEMIENSIKRTENGLEMSKKLADIFKEILTTVQKVSEVSKEVETASLQQDEGINQVNKAIIQFDEVVQGNASSAEETASSAEELLSQVDTLNEIVKQLVFIVTGKEESIEKKQQLYIQHQEKKVDIKNKQKAIKQKTIPERIDPQEKQKKKEIKPETVIPFEEDEEFKEY